VPAPTLSPGVIVAIAIACFVVFFSALVVVAVLVARRRDKDKQRALEVERGGHDSVEMKTGSLPHPPAATLQFSKRDSSNPFMPLDDGPIWNDWTGGNSVAIPTRNKSRRSSGGKGSFRITGLRDSWPLVANIPLPMLPDQSNIQLSNVAAPGYEIVSEPKWPKRTASARTTVSVPREDSPRKRPHFNDLYPTTRKPQMRNAHVRSVSESQLTTILRSTSERLKSTNRRSLTRTLTSLDRPADKSPLQPLSRLPRRKKSESRECMVESDFGASPLQSPMESPARSSARRVTRSPQSPTPTLTSDDSLYASSRRESLIPLPLSSPSKSRKPRMRISSAENRDLPSLVKGKNQPDWAAHSLNLQRSLSLSATPKPSLGDPLSSKTKASISSSPGGVVEPRPLFICRSAFGEKTIQRPQSCAGPIQHISEQLQAPLKKPQPPPHLAPVLGRTGSNPFRWSTQEIIQSRSTSTSPTRKRGQRRPRVSQMSQIPRLMSVGVVPEESEDEMVLQRVRNIMAPNSPHPSSAIEPIQIGGNNIQPPSIATFNPILAASKSGGNSPALKMRDSLSMYSKMRSGNNYRTRNPVTSKNELVTRPQFKPPPSRSQSRLTSIPTKRPDRNISAENLVPSPEHGLLVTSPTPILSPTLPESRTAETPRLPRTSTIYTPTAPPLFMQHSKAFSAPLPPLVTIPGHLTGPRAEPAKRDSDSTPGKHLAPPQSMQTSIAMLKRMNSDVTMYTASPNESPRPAAQSSTLPLQMDVNFQAVMDANSQAVMEESRRIAEEKRKLLSQSSFIKENAQMRGSARHRRQMLIDEKGRESTWKQHKMRKSREIKSKISDSSDDVDHFLRKRGLVAVVEGALAASKEIESTIPGLNTFDSQGSQGSIAAQAALKYPTTSTSISSTSTSAEPPSMASMMGTGTLADFFSVESKPVDADTFEHGSDSETEYETVEKADEETAPPSPTGTDDILALYSHSPAPSLSLQSPQPRWSSATPVPPARSVRRESNLKHPKPRTPPSWVWSRGGLGLGRHMESELESETQRRSIISEEEVWDADCGGPTRMGGRKSTFGARESHAGRLNEVAPRGKLDVDGGFF